MAERAFFSPHNAEGSCSNTSGQVTPQNDLCRKPSECHLLDEWRKLAKLKSDIVSHPLYEQLLEAHVACLCVGLPSQYFPELETQLANKHSVAIKYLNLGKDVAPDFDCRKEIDEFMESYLLLLYSLKKHLEEHLLPPTAKAMVQYCELEQAFRELTGNSSIELANTTWCDAELTEEDFNFGIVEYDGFDDFKVGLDMQKERDHRSLMEHVRQELKHELKEGYLECLTSIRDEILRKRQASKLPVDTTILKKWWNAHSKWPYPTEEDKRHMAQETGLELRQINNWFINHRNRNWSSTTY